MLFTDDGTDDPDPPMIELVIQGERAVILFEDKEKLSVFARWAAEKILEPGQQIAAVSAEFSSFEEAVQEFRQADPTFDGVYMTDSHPFVTQLAGELRQRGA